jgi:hypothetical protein
MRTEAMTAEEERECASGSSARRHGFWAGVMDFLLSIPPGVCLRIGG